MTPARFRVAPLTAVWAVVLQLATAHARAAPATTPATTPWTETRYALRTDVDFTEARLVTRCALTVRNNSDQPARDVPLLLYRLLRVDSLRALGSHARWSQAVVAFEDEPRRQVNAIRVMLANAVAAHGTITLEIDFSGYLAGYVETGNLYVRDRIDPAYTILREDCLAYPVIGTLSRRAYHERSLPSFDYEAWISAPDTLVVANGGALLDRQANATRSTYHFRNIKPAWRMDFAIAPFVVLEDGPVRVYALRSDSVGGRRVRDAFQRSFDLFSRWFGPLPSMPGFAIIELPDGWGSQNDVTSILQTAASFRDSTHLHETYHEVSHMWNVESADRPSPRIEEGLASYLEEVAADRLDGAARVPRLNARYAAWLRDQFAQHPEYASWPMRDYGSHGSTDLSYVVGYYMFECLHMLLGEQAFGSLIGGFRSAYAGRKAGVDDFVAYAKSHSPMNLDAFFNDWLYTTRWFRFVQAGTPVDTWVASYREASGPTGPR